jgi:hypothetical protein
MNKRKSYLADIKSIRRFLREIGCRLIFYKSGNLVKGHYKPDDKKIFINLRINRTYKERLLTLLHEVAHAYSHIVIQKSAKMNRDLVEALNLSFEDRTPQQAKLVYEDEKNDLKYMPFVYNYCGIKSVSYKALLKEYLIDLAIYKHLTIYRTHPSPLNIDELSQVIRDTESLIIPFS